MTVDCKYCGAVKSYRVIDDTGTRVVWKCGTRQDSEKQVDNQSLQCRVTQLEAKNKELRNRLEEVKRN